jgi:hypothetical protein
MHRSKGRTPLPLSREHQLELGRLFDRDIGDFVVLSHLLLTAIGPRREKLQTVSFDHLNSKAHGS